MHGSDSSRSIRQGKGRIRAAGSDSPALLRRVVSENLRPQARRYAVALLFMVVAAAATAAWAWLQKDLVDEVFFKRDATKLLPITLGIILLPMLKGIASYGQELILSRISNRIVADTYRRIYAHIMSFNLGFFTTLPSSQLIARVSRGANAAGSVMNLLVLTAGRDLLTLVALTAVMLVQAPILFVVVAVMGPLVVIAVTRLVKRVRQQMTLEFALNARSVQLVQETAHGARTMKGYNLAVDFARRMEETTAAIEARANSIARLQARATPILEAISGVALGLITLYCGWLAIYGEQQPGAFVSFAAALMLAYEPAKRLARLRINLEVNVVGLRMLYRLLDRPADATEKSGLAQLTATDGTIEFRDVEFAYRRDRPVLRSVNLRFAAGTRTAIVGPSGAGKTTILSLIPRFFEVTGGAILIDEIDIRDYSSASLRQHIAIVSQDAYLFSGSIRDNIRLGRLDASDDEVRAAAVDARADEFIVALAQGYDTDVGENGVQLSGGQRQRIAIARAILKNAPILLLDEATSSLDSESERRIQLALDRLTVGRTTIVVAHRLSTVLKADRIVVIDEGRVVEEGTHDQLISGKGLYARLHAQQFADVSRERFYTD